VAGSRKNGGGRLRSGLNVVCHEMEEMKDVAEPDLPGIVGGGGAESWLFYCTQDGKGLVGGGFGLRFVEGKVFRISGGWRRCRVVVVIAGPRVCGGGCCGNIGCVYAGRRIFMA